MKPSKKTAKLSASQIKKLQDEVLELRQVVRSIQAGEIDAVVVKPESGKEAIFTLEGEDQPYRLLVESLSEGALTIDNEGKIFHCNKKFAIMVNETVESIIGSTIFAHIAVAQHQKLYQLLSVARNASLQDEFTLLVKNNTNKVVLLSCNTMKLGSINGTSIVVTDVTQLSNEYTRRINIQKKLVKQEILFRRLTENINDVFWVMTPEVDKILYISPGYEKVWGRSLKSLYANSMEWMESVVEEDKEKVVRFLERLQKQEFSYENYRIVKPNGEERYIFVKAYHNKDEHGKVIDIFGIASDVTELTTITNQLHLNDKLTMVGILAAGVAHEINNPIAWIRTNLLYIKKRAAKIDSIKLVELIDESIEGVDRIIDIVQNLKGFSRNNDNELAPIDLQTIIDLALKIAFSEINSHAILEKNYLENPLLVRANGGKMQQVFLNLIMNAIQAMNKDNKENNILRITTAQEDDRIRIDISDTGSGIKPENIPKVFDPFFTTKGKNMGSGIGLSISHEIIKNHGGDITVKSKVGEGTTFSVFLPIDTSLVSNK